MTCLVVLLNTAEKENEVMIESSKNDIENGIEIGNGSEIEKSKKNEEISEVIKAEEMKIIDATIVYNTDTLGHREKEVNIMDENLEKKRRKNNFKFQLKSFVREYL
jgi:hypothetical protein